MAKYWSDHCVSISTRSIADYTQSGKDIINFLHNKVRKYYILKLIMDFIEPSNKLDSERSYAFREVHYVYKCNCEVLSRDFEYLKGVDDCSNKRNIRDYIYSTGSKYDDHYLYYFFLDKEETELDMTKCTTNGYKEKIGYMASATGNFSKDIDNQIVFEFLIYFYYEKRV
jgi:hypothetical protein